MQQIGCSVHGTKARQAATGSPHKASACWYYTRLPLQLLPGAVRWVQQLPGQSMDSDCRCAAGNDGAGGQQAVHCRQ